MDERLAVAHERYAARDFLQAFALCKEVLEARPDCVDALALFAQISLIASEFTAALACLRRAQHLDPDHAQTRALLAGDIGHEWYREILRADAGLANHTSAYVFASPVADADRLETALREIAVLLPEHAGARAALANLLGRSGKLSAALDEYAGAVALDPQHAGVRLGYAERLQLTGESNRAREQLDRALAIERTYVEPATGTSDFKLLALFAPDFWEKNVLVDLLVDRDTTDVVKRYVGSSFDPVPVADAMFCALADPENRDALEAAARTAGAAGMPVFNDPARLPHTSRTYLWDRRLLHPHLTVPRSVRANTSELDVHRPPVRFPLLIRPLDSHRGAGLELVRDAESLQAYAGRAPGLDAVLTEYVEYKSDDGYYRKYRFIFVGGVPHPYHLAISPEWMVHYFSAPMDRHQWMRDEEARFLREPSAVFHRACWDALRLIGAEVGLDYFGLDCGTAGGNVLVFEANANMLVQNFYDERLFGYKKSAFARIQQSFNAMIRGRRSPR